MRRQHLLETLAATMNELFETPRSAVVPEARLYEELDLDSIDAIDLVMKIQTMTGQQISPQDFKHVRTVGDVLDCIEKMLAQDETAAS
jgi:acyl carrier protein